MAFTTGCWHGIHEIFGVFWQVEPTIAWELVNDPDPAKSQRVVDTVLGMTKLDAATLKRAYAGE